MGYPYVQARHHGLDNNLRPSRIVIHATVTPCGKGWALNVAKQFATTSRDASAHYVVDPGAIVQCLSEKTVGYHAPPNLHSIGIELTDPQKGEARRWQDAAHEAMLQRAAGLVRDIAHRYDIPLVKLTPADLRAGKRGICGHVDVTYAWHLTTHIDPGVSFPWAHFMDLLRGDDDEVTPAEIKAIVDQTTANVLAALKDVPHAVWAYATPRPGNTDLAAGRQLGSANVNSYRAVKLLQSDNLAAEIAAALPAGASDQAAIEAALRNVLGGLDEEKA